MITNVLYSGLLSDYFEIIAFKTLSKVGTILGSNQHEFNGDHALKELFRLCNNTTFEKKQIYSTFIYLNEDESQNIFQDAFLTWYDARAKSHDKTGRSEYRLYYQTNDATKRMKKGDFLAIARKNDVFHVIIAQHNSTAEKQIMWLFGVEKIEDNNKFQIKKIQNTNNKVTFASRFILDILGIKVQELNENYLEIMQKRFDNKIPSTSELSQFTLELMQKEIDPIEEPDVAIVRLFEKEEVLYKTLERIKIVHKLQNGFIENNNVDVDSFLQFSLSIQNARKSRAGKALENHLSFIFNANKVMYTHSGITENKSKPDFIFPNIAKYHDIHFADTGLSMLASKTTCKDRWRQILSEAKRIKKKHLFTLEPSISENQTQEMKSNDLTLVLPNEIKATYTINQQQDIINLKDFLLLVKTRQNKYINLKYRCNKLIVGSSNHRH
jgi:hypothetical protein